MSDRAHQHQPGQAKPEPVEQRAAVAARPVDVGDLDQTAVFGTAVAFLAPLGLRLWRRWLKQSCDCVQVQMLRLENDQLMAPHGFAADRVRAGLTRIY